MSGRSIGTIAGAVIGFVVPAIGVPLGATIGGMIGGLVDPETLQGAQFSGRSIAGSESGLGRPIIFGTAPCDGRLMDGEDEPRLGTRTESAGKGGPEIEHDTALLSYAIEICESSELRGTAVESVIAAWEDEKLVYDVREDALVSDADNAKWLINKSFHYGKEDQEPSALLQSIHGVGNVPAYRGTCRMDVEDEDLVLHGERIPRYRFLVSRCPLEPASIGQLLVVGNDATFGSGKFWMADATASPEFFSLAGVPNADIVGFPAAYGDEFLVAGTSGIRRSYDPLNSWEIIDDSGITDANRPVGGPDGWLLGSDDFFTGTSARLEPEASAISAYLFSASRPGTSFTDAVASSKVFYTAGKYWAKDNSVHQINSTDSLDEEWTIHYIRGDDGTDYSILNDICEFDDALYAVLRIGLGDVRQLRRSTDGGDTWPDLVLDTDVDPQLLRTNGNALVVYCSDGSYVRTSADDFAEDHLTGLSMSAAYPITTCGPFVYIISPTHIVSTLDGITFSTPVAHGVVGAYGIAASGTGSISGGGIAIPDAPGYEVDPITGEIIGPASDVGNACGIYLDVVVREIHRLGSKQLTDDMFDLDALAEFYVRGYVLQDVGLSAADGIEPLRRVYFFDLPEYDGQIHAVLRGGDIDWTIDPDDIIPGEESTLDGKRGDQTKYPKNLKLTYAALSTDYKPTTQTAEDINPDTFTNTEESYQTALVLNDDEAAKVADVMLKVMRTEREDEQRFTLPIQYVGIVASDLLSVEGRRYRVDQMRVERNRVVIERAVRDSASAYYSAAVGVEGIQRPPPVSTVRGPVASAVMNLPVLRDEDDRAGIYWAAAGYLPGYRGALLQMSRDGVTFENGPEITPASTMGLLADDLPSASRYAQDNTNTLRVRMYPGGRDLNSTTFEGLLEEANVAAILYPDGTAEIVQFQTAVETDEREYELTGLMRGRQNTEPGEHLAGAKFVMLDDDVRFVDLRPDDVGRTLTFRAVSLGTRPEDNVTQTIDMDTIESLREWMPYNLTVESDGAGGYCATWIGRGRLGSSRVPFHSQWFAGYRVTFTEGPDAVETDTLAQAFCMDAAAMTAAFGGGYGVPTVTVRARSRIATDNNDFDSPDATG